MKPPNTPNQPFPPGMISSLHQRRAAPLRAQARNLGVTMNACLSLNPRPNPSPSPVQIPASVQPPPTPAWSRLWHFSPELPHGVQAPGTFQPELPSELLPSHAHSGPHPKPSPTAARSCSFPISKPDKSHTTPNLPTSLRTQSLPLTFFKKDRILSLPTVPAGPLSPCAHTPFPRRAFTPSVHHCSNSLSPLFSTPCQMLQSQ